MSPVELVTFVKTTTSRFDKDEREYLTVMFQKELFGALLTACHVRKEEAGFSRVELAERMGKDKSVITRLLQNYSNMKADTIAEFANAVEADIAFYLIDRRDRNRIFTGHGVEYYQWAWHAWGEAAKTMAGQPATAAALNSFSIQQLSSMMATTPNAWAQMLAQVQDVAREGVG